MSTTVQILSMDELKAQPDSPDPSLRAYAVGLQVSGTYLHASPPAFNIFSDAGGFKSLHMGATAVAVQTALALRDRFDGNVASATAGRMTVLNSGVSFSTVNNGSTNDKISFLIAANGAANGLVGAGAEVADGTSVAGIYQLIVLLSLSAT